MANPATAGYASYAGVHARPRLAPKERARTRGSALL